MFSQQERPNHEERRSGHEGEVPTTREKVQPRGRSSSHEGRRSSHKGDGSTISISIWGTPQRGGVTGVNRLGTVVRDGDEPDRQSLGLKEMSALAAEVRDMALVSY